MSPKGRCGFLTATILSSLRAALGRLSLAVLATMLSPRPARVAEASHRPAAIVEDVSGRTWIRGPSGSVRAGVLSGLQLLDTLVVETGRAVIVDLRTGARSALGAGSRLPIVETVGRHQPGILERLEQLLRDFELRGVRSRKAGGVRGEGALEPDGDSVSTQALGVLRWTGVPGARFIAVVNARGDSVMAPLSAPAGSGAWDWPLAVHREPGAARWHLFAGRDEQIASAHVIVLTDADAESLRARYLAEAARRAPVSERQLTARLLAAIDGYRLW